LIFPLTIYTAFFWVFSLAFSLSVSVCFKFVIGLHLENVFAGHRKGMATAFPVADAANHALSRCSVAAKLVPILHLS
jgi:hypothetical protein